MILNKHFSTLRILTVLCFILGVLILYKPTFDNDFGWHITYGKYFIENHRIIYTNFFSYIWPNYVWANSYWLSEVVIYVLYKFIGLSGLSLVFSLLLETIIFLLYKRVNSKSPVTLLIALTLIPLVVSTYIITTRSLFFSTAFLILIICILFNKRKLPWYTPLIFLFWANLHADFMLGLFIIGIFTAGNFLEDLFNKTLNIRETVNNTTLTLISAGITILNPYRIDLWLTLIKEVFNTQQSKLSEYQSIFVLYASKQYDVVSFYAYQIIGILILITSVICTYQYRKQKSNKLWYFVIVLFFFIYSLKKIYFFRIFGIVGIVSFSIFWGDVLTSKYLKLNQQVKKGIKVITLSTISMAILAITPYALNMYGMSTNFKVLAETNKYPYGAIKYIQSNPIDGNMLNNYNWGGYLIWQLPQYKTFIDGRMSAWNQGGKYILTDYLALTEEPSANKSLLNKYINDNNIKWVLDRPDSQLIRYLINNDWQIVYRDTTSTIVKK